jgi:FkbM family methyltransferase
MSSMIARVWNTSPASLTHAIRRRLRNVRAGESWHQMSAGPAQGVSLILPEPLPDWAQEMIAGTYDKFLYDAIARHSALAGATCWDIGANIGYHTHGFATQGAHVVSFEPNPANVARLRQHLEKNPAAAKRVRVMPVAVADRDGKLEFVQSADVSAQSSGSHLASATPPEHATVYARFERSSVPAVTMDTLVEQD